MTTRRPAALGAAAFVLGTLGGLHAGDTARSAGFALALTLSLAFFVPRRPRLWLRLCGCLLLGWALAAAPGARMRANLTRLVAAADNREQITVEGIVAGTVRTRAASRGEICRRFVLNRLELAVDDRLEPLPRAAIAVNWYGPSQPADAAEAPQSGQRWRLTGMLLHARRSTSGTSGSTPIRHLMITRARASTQITVPQAAWRTWLETCRQTAAKRLAAGIEEHRDEVALVQAMMLGYRSEIPRSLNRAFRHSGTIHIFAISGLHVVVIAALLTFVVARLGVPRHLWILPLAPLLALYIVATGGRPSALRAGLMAGLYLLAPLLGRRPDALTTLALSAMLLLLVNPLLLLDMGFVLSFTMVLGLILLAGPTTRTVYRVLRIDRLAQRIDLINQQGGDLAQSNWRVRQRALGLFLAERVAELFAVSLAAWLVSAPLTAYYFGFFPAYSLLANLLVVPLSSLVMLLASLSLLTTSLSPTLGMLCNQAVWLAASAMKHIAVAIANWPQAAIELSLPLACVAFWYGALGWLAWRETRAHTQAASDATWLEQVLNERGSS